MTARCPPLPQAGRYMQVSELVAIASNILRLAGLRRDDAEQMASVLVFAQASGIDSHGLMHLPQYIGGIASGTVRARPEHRTVSRRAGVAVLDGDDGPGILSALAATQLAIKLAADAGVGAVAVKYSGHFGVAGAYVERMAAAGMVGLVLSNASPTVAPRGGTLPAFGTNPIAAGFPRTDGVPVIIDLSMTVGSRARIRKAKAAGEQIPIEWALDENGQPTPDPAAALAGTMQALGGTKGTALGLMVELFCVALSDGLTGTSVRPPQDANAVRSGVSHLFVAFDTSAFSQGGCVAAKVDEIALGIESGPPADADQAVRMPGTRAAERRHQSEQDGVFVTQQIADALSWAKQAADAITASAPAKAAGA